MAIKLGGSSGGGSGDSSWDSVLLLVPFDADTTDVKSSIAPTVSGSAIAITGSGKYGSYGANTAGNTSSYATGAFGGGDWTVEFWLERESFFDTNAKILDLGAVEIEASGNDDINFYHVTSDANFGTTVNSLTQGQWFHIAIVYDGGTLRSYVDGVQLGSLTTSVTDPTSVVLGNTASFDDLRVTASARYPGGTTFTPPTAAHPASGAGSTGDISALYLGSSAVSAAYLGSTSIYSAGGGDAGAGVTVLIASGNVAATSTDGATWASHAVTAASWYSLAYGNATFVAVANNSNKAVTSPDGVTWTLQTLPVNQSWRELGFGGGLFVALGWGSSTAATSTDGISWAQQTLPVSRSWAGVAHGNSTFVAVAYDSTSVITSADGASWAQSSMPARRGWSDVAFGNGVFVAVSRDTGPINYNPSTAAATSADGVTWTSQTLPDAAVWQSVTFGDGKFVAVATDFSDKVATSADGVTWASQTLPVALNWQSVRYSNGLFVAVALGSATAAISTDGVTWTTTTLPSSEQWYGVA